MFDRNKLRVEWERGAFILTGGIVAFLVLVPVGILVWSSFRTGRPGFPGGTYTLANYVKAYVDPSTYSCLLNSVLYATGDSILSISIAITLAWLLERTNMPFRNLGYALILVPMAIPGMLFSIAWSMLLTPSIGFINIVLRGVLNLFGFNMTEGPFNIYSLPGMVFLGGLRSVPTLLLMIVGAFRMMDPSLEEAALVAGAGRLTSLRRVVIPVLRPAIFVAFIYVFIGALEQFEIPAVIGIPAGIFVFSTKIFFEATAKSPPDFGLTNAYGVAFIIISIGLLYWYAKATARAERFATITGKGYRPRVIDLGSWRYPAFLLLFSYFFLIVVLPVFILLWNSLMPYYQAPSFKALSQISLKNYEFILKVPRVTLAVKNTLTLVALTPFVTMFIAFMVSWVAVRSKVKGRRLLDSVAFLPHTMPSVVIGLALVLVYLNLRFIPIYGTIWIILIGLVTKYIAYGTRTSTSAILQVHKELEEAADVSGASPLKKIMQVTLPLILPAFVNGFIWVAVHSMREVSIALMLFSKKNAVISSILWELWQDGRATETSALGVMLILTLVIITVSGRIIVRRLSRQY